MAKIGNDFVFNKHNARIKKCCASCMHIAYGKGEDERICAKGEGNVPKDWVCEDWCLKPDYEEIKFLHLGHVKKPHYVRWQLQKVDEVARMDIDIKQKREIVMNLPFVYERIYGSRYLKSL